MLTVYEKMNSLGSKYLRFQLKSKIVSHARAKDVYRNVGGIRFSGLDTFREVDVLLKMLVASEVATEHDKDILHQAIRHGGFINLIKYLQS